MSSVYSRVRVLVDTTDDSEDASHMQLAKKIVLGSGRELTLFATHAVVTVVCWNRPDIGVEVTGPNYLVTPVDIGQGAFGPLTITAGGNLPLPPSTEITSPVTLPTPARDKAAATVSVRIYAPPETKMFMRLRSAQADITGRMGPLHVSLRDGSVQAEHISGSLRAEIRKCGKVHVRHGKVWSLCVSTAGRTDFRFGGVANQAWLSAAGRGKIRVDRITQLHYQSPSRSGSIKVKHKK